LLHLPLGQHIEKDGFFVYIGVKKAEAERAIAGLVDVFSRHKP
jgi:hypothetical protein